MSFVAYGAFKKERSFFMKKISGFFKAIGRYFKNFGVAFAKGDIWVKLSAVIMGAGYFARKQIVNGLIMLIVEATIFVIMVSYAMSCMRFNGRKQIMSASLILNMFPGPLLMIAIYFILKMLGLTNSHFGMIIVYSAGSGLGFLIMKGFMDTIPMSLKEAARLEGASEAKIFMKVILPLCKPIVVYQVISSFLIPWGDFVFAKLMLNSGVSKDWTVAIGLYNMLEKSLVNKYFSVFCAGGIVVAIPISILFVIMQKYYVEGVTGGSVKG